MTEEFDKEKIIEKIKKLLALAQSANENEAALAAARAQEMLAKYNIEVQEVEKEVSSNIGNEGVVFKYSAPWQRGLRKACANMYFCSYYFADDYEQVVRGKRVIYAKREKHFYVGEPHNRAIAILMSEYLIEAVRRLAKEGAKKIPADERTTYKNSFRLFAAKKLTARILDRIEELKAKSVKTSDGTTLPALASMYDQALTKNKEWLDENIDLKYTTSRPQQISTQGMLDGSKAGNDISLDSQIGSDSGKTALLTGGSK